MKIRSTAYPTLELLQTLYPRVFVSDDKEILPLKINIHNDLFITLKDQASKRSIRDALKIYTKRPAYWKKLVLGAERVDLDGAVCGVVEADHLELGKQAIIRASERIKEQRQQNAPSEKSPAKPTSKTSRVHKTDKSVSERTPRDERSAERPAKANFLRKGQQQNRPRVPHPAHNANALPKFNDLNKSAPRVFSKPNYRSESATELPRTSEKITSTKSAPVILMKKRRHFEKPEEE